jgi:amphi-Trp domain-containing protein
MAKRARAQRDIERDYPHHQLAQKLRRLADCLDHDKQFRIQIGGVRVLVPPSATINLEHEVTESDEEVEFQLKWSLAPEAPEAKPAKRKTAKRKTTKRKTAKR